nr:MAG TPA: hypothetical protein [Caudoviricetes sp.]
MLYLPYVINLKRYDRKPLWTIYNRFSICIIYRIVALSSVCNKSQEI